MAVMRPFPRMQLRPFAKIRTYLFAGRGARANTGNNAEDSVPRAQIPTAASEANTEIGKIAPTDEAQVLEFVSAIRPVSTNHDLIRIGGDADGGYLIPDDLQGVECCFSPGVANSAGFEADLAARGIRCFLADHSVDAPPIENALFDFEKKYLGMKEDDRFTTLESWMRRKAPDNNDMILQMDIEGYEYHVIVVTPPETLRKFRIIVIEFHDLAALRQQTGFKIINFVFRKLLTDFEIVHIHPNNTAGSITYGDVTIPPVMEFTFLRKDRISNKQRASRFPHPLDRRNKPSLADLPLPECWYQAD
jgi:hypothetical protein